MQILNVPLVTTDLSIILPLKEKIKMLIRFVNQSDPLLTFSCICKRRLISEVLFFKGLTC